MSFDAALHNKMKKYSKQIHNKTWVLRIFLYFCAVKRATYNNLNSQKQMTMKKWLYFLTFLLSITISYGCNQVSQKESTVDSLEMITKGEWEYRTSVDEMYDTKVYFARKQAETSVGIMNILIRFRNDDGNHVFLDMKGSLFDFGYNKKNFVTIRFDKDEPVKYVVRPLDNGSDQSVALSKPIDFIKRAKSATTILIETPIFNESTQLFKFEMDNPLKWEH